MRGNERAWPLRFHPLPTLSCPCRLAARPLVSRTSRAGATPATDTHRADGPWLPGATHGPVRPVTPKDRNLARHLRPCRTAASSLAFQASRAGASPATDTHRAAGLGSRLVHEGGDPTTEADPCPTWQRVTVTGASHTRVRESSTLSAATSHRHSSPGSGPPFDGDRSARMVRTSCLNARCEVLSRPFLSVTRSASRPAVLRAGRLEPRAGNAPVGAPRGGRLPP